MSTNLMNMGIGQQQVRIPKRKPGRRNGRDLGNATNTSVRITWLQHDWLQRRGDGNISAAIREAIDKLMVEVP